MIVFPFLVCLLCFQRFVVLWAKKNRQGWLAVFSEFDFAFLLSSIAILPPPAASESRKTRNNSDSFAQSWRYRYHRVGDSPNFSIRV